MEYTIEKREIEPLRVAFTKYEGPAVQASSYMPAVFKSINGQASGAPFFIYKKMDPVTGIGSLELCVPTEVEPHTPGIETKTIPGGTAFTVIHHGPYSGLREAYAAIDEYAVVNNIRIAPPFREVYIKGPGMIFKGNPDKYITEIIFPVISEER